MPSWTETGRAFGYPECCIAEFAARARKMQQLGIKIPARVGEWTGTGFIPCSCCASLIRHLGLTAFVDKWIKPRRKIETPFTFATPSRCNARLAKERVEEDRALDKYFGEKNALEQAQSEAGT
jgi:hypothetical protein